LTYGYVQKKPVELYAMKGDALSDIMLKLTQVAELDLTIKFKHEGVFEQLPFDAHVRIRVLNDANKVVGEFLTSDCLWQPQYEVSTKSLWYTWNLVRRTASPLANSYANDPTSGHRQFWRLNYVPQGTDTMRVRIAGLPDMYGWDLGYACDPCAATGDFGYEDRPIDAPYGIDAYPNYKGGWRIQVNVVPVFDYYPGHLYNKIEVNSPVFGNAHQTNGVPLSPTATTDYTHNALFMTAPLNPLGFEQCSPVN